MSQLINPYCNLAQGHEAHFTPSSHQVIAPQPDKVRLARPNDINTLSILNNIPFTNPKNQQFQCFICFNVSNTLLQTKTKPLSHNPTKTSAHTLNLESSKQPYTITQSLTSTHNTKLCLRSFSQVACMVETQDRRSSHHRLRTTFTRLTIMDKGFF